MHLLFDIFQGVGVAAAVGIRPFLPTLLVGLLAAANAEIHFRHTALSFLQSGPFLLAIAVLAVGLLVLERRSPDQLSPRAAGGLLLAVAGLGLGALLFAGSLLRGHYAAAPGYVGGVICAAIGVLATGPLFARARGRLDPATAGALPMYQEAVAVSLAVLSVLAPPVGPIALALLLWLLVAGRRREGQKYAGLRILR